MKHSNDIVRVLRGVNLVIDQIIVNGKQSSPELKRKADRLSSHALQLVKTILDFRNEDIPTTNRTDEVKPTPTKVDNISNNSFKSEDIHSQIIIPNTKLNIHEPSIETSVPQNLHIENLNTQESLTTNNTDLSSSNTSDIHVSSSSSSSPTATEPTGINKSNDDDLIGFPKSSNTSTTVVNEASDGQSSNKFNSDNTHPISSPKVQMKARAVPSSQLARMWGFGTLAAQMAFGVATESASRILEGSQSNQTISDRNAEVLAEALCRMRGAALKLGQMLSLHDEGILPPALVKALERVRQGADYMPRHQLEQQLKSQLGPLWREKFLEFDEIPIAAASIGQVHKGKLLDGTEVAVKIQYPGVADSIESDLHNLKRLVNMTNMLPPGLFIDQIMQVAQTELAEECDYKNEAENQIQYREFVLADTILRKHVYVPQVYPHLSTSRVLTSVLVPGISIEKAASLPQSVRNAIARTTLITTIRELFEWRLVQSDPNYGNFLYDDPSKTINMIDFGAARKYSKKFVDGYIRLVWAAANRDKDTLITVSKDLGFLTGDESPEMLYAHAETGLVVGEPFLSNEPYDFATSNLSTRISKYGGTFMKYRLTAPPVETYSLHRKLAGAFLLCIRLKANIPCRDILEDTYKSYKFD